jgi:rhodanese-related sulfurtransferase
VARWRSPTQERIVPEQRRSVLDVVAEAKARVEELTVDELVDERGRRGDDATVIDIRDVRERWRQGAIPGAVSMPRGMLEFWLDPDSPYHREGYTVEQRYVLYCAGGMRSALAADALLDLGFLDVAHLEPGFAGWIEAGGEVEDVPSRRP